MVFKKILSPVVAASMVLSSLTAFAVKSNTIDITSYIGDEVITGNVFVGETVKTVVGIEGMPDYTAYDLGFKYNNTVIQLAPLDPTSSGDKTQSLHDFETEAVGIDFSDYSETQLKKTRSYAMPNVVRLDQEENIIAQYGAIMSSRKTAAADFTDPMTAVDEHTDLFTIEFNANAPGTSGFTWLNGVIDGWDIFDITNFDIGVGSNADYCKFPGVTLSKEIANFTVIDAPADPTGVDWAAGEGVYTVNWTEPATGCRGYEVTVYVNDVAGTPVTVTDTTYDLLAEGVIGTLTTGDMVKVSVKALGGVGSNAVETPEKEITGTPLEDITPVMGENEVLTWNAVENAAGYIIEVYDSKGNLADVGAINVSKTETSYDLSDVITVDDYTIKVVADGNSPLYINSEKTISYSTGATIIGKVKVELGDDSLTPNPNHKTKVTLINDATGDEYWDECDADGSFAIAGVPGDITNGISYSVKIERTSSLTRTQFGRYNDKLVIKKSVEHNICAQIKDNQGVPTGERMPLTIYAGYFDTTDGSILSGSFDAISVNYLIRDGQQGFDSKFDLVDGDGIITLEDITVVTNNYGKGTAHYSSAKDYNFTIAE